MCMYVEYMQKCSAVSDLEHLSGNSRYKYRRSPAFFRASALVLVTDFFFWLYYIWLSLVPPTL